jgi:hypothetical protein
MDFHVVHVTSEMPSYMSLILNTTVPSSDLKKKHNTIACHLVREAIAAIQMRCIFKAGIINDGNYGSLFTQTTN